MNQKKTIRRRLVSWNSDGAAGGEGGGIFV